MSDHRPDRPIRRAQPDAVGPNPAERWTDAETTVKIGILPGALSVFVVAVTLSRSTGIGNQSGVPMMSLLFVACLTAVFDDELPTIRGVDLNQFPTVEEKSVAEFFEMVPTGQGKQKRAWRKSVLKLPVTIEKPQSAWIYFPTGSEHFYLRYRSNSRDPKTEQLFGPIEGDPFNKLKLEAELIEKLKSGDAHNIDYFLKRMLRTEDKSLARRAFRILYRMTERNVEGYGLEENIGNVNRISSEFRKTLEKHCRPEQLKKFDEKIVSAQKKIDSLVKEFPDSEYTLAKDVEPVVPDEIPATAWGKSISGLRMAIVPKQDSDTNFGTANWLLLVVENTDKKPIRLSVSDVTQSAQLQVTLPNKKPTRPQSTWFSGIAPIKRYLIHPGEKMVLGKLGLTARVDRAAGGGNEFGVSIVTHKPTGGVLELAVTCKLLVGYGSAWSRDPDNIMRRVSPAKGEFKGILETGSLNLSFTQRAK